MASLPAKTDAEQVQHHLATMQNAMINTTNAYHCFLASAEKFDWSEAEKFQLAASAYQESAMDHFMSACRIQQKMAGGA